MSRPSRFTIYPIEHPQVWQMYKTACSAVWFPEELQLSKDIDDWVKLSDNEQHFIKNILAFFSASDGIVNYNLTARFYNEVDMPEAQAFYAFQIFIETIHSETYSLLIDTLIKDTQEKEHLFNAVETIPCVKRKATWALKYIEDTTSTFPLRLIAFAIVEGVMFSGSFAAIYWLKESGNKLPGLCQANELISRDESMHAEFAVMLYNMQEKDKRIPEAEVIKVMTEAVDIEIEFITESIPCSMLGMNSGLMSDYIKFVADRLMLQLGYDKIYNTNNSFPFMNRIAMENKTNFFEGRNTNYVKANVGKTNVHEFSTESDF